MPRTDRRYGSPRWRKLTHAIQVRDLWTCQYCGGPSSLTDHVIPVVHGGSFWDESNLVACCRSCNQGRRQNGEAWVPPNRREPATAGRVVPFRPVQLKPRIY
jgi:5-methylcytosine-specific restriction endonuclease McrA